MQEIGVRVLKARLSEVLRRVADGEPVRVTVRNRPVADILPVAGAARDARVRELIADGRLTPPARPRPTRAPRLAQSERSASEIVIADRNAER